MDIYWFDVDVAGPVTEDQVEVFAEVLTREAEGIDATVQAGDEGGKVMFARCAPDAVHAVVSAIGHVEASGMRVTGVTEDLVSVEEVAERARVTAASVRYWITGARGPGDFPDPVVRRARSSLYSWADVSWWMARARLGTADETAAATAGACAVINAALTLRDGLARLPEASRPLVTRLVA